MDYLKSLKIRDQILLAMIIGSIVSTSILGIIIYHISKHTIQNNYKNAHTYNLQVSNNIIDIQLNSIIEQGRSVVSNDVFIKAMTSDMNKKDSRYFSSINSLTINRVIGDIVSRDKLIEGITIINENGNIIFYSKKNIPSNYYKKYYQKDNILEEDWTIKASDAKGKEVFYGYNILIPDQEVDTICFVKNLINPQNHESMGYMIVNISKKLLDKAFGTLKEGYSTKRYIIIDENSVFPGVYFNDNSARKSDIIGDYLSENKSGKYLYSSYLNESTGWMAVNVIEKQELQRDSAYVGGATLIAIFALILLSVYISRIISNQINKPLKILEDTIESVGEGNFHIDAEFDSSEIGIIGGKFKEMVNNNLELRESLLKSRLNEREAELLLLQAQINPHFLYNTLDSLYFMAIINGEENIAKMVLALSNNFKLSLNKGDRFIRVEDEIARIKDYMTIQNMRYNNRFDLILDCDAVSDIKIITFILQPFVENAMYHGLEAKLGRGYIKITARIENHKLSFEISDDGVGLSDLSVLDNGYGVKNVKERIRLFYGEEYGVSFTSERNVGTTVRIVIPAILNGGGYFAQDGSD